MSYYFELVKMSSYLITITLIKKAHYDEVANPIEHRLIELGKTSTYNTLISQIRNQFEITFLSEDQDQDVKIYWLDCENRMIRFSDDIGLKLALQQHKETRLTLYITKSINID